jgi:phage baseplate assembly protein V
MLQRFIEPLKNRFLNLLGRAIIKAVDDSQDFQRITFEGLKDEQRANVLRMQRFGFNSVPPVGSKAIMGFFAGDRRAGFVIADDDPETRKKNLGPGEVTVYDAYGNFMHLQGVTMFHVKHSDQITLEAPLVKVIGALQVTETSLLEQLVTAPLGIQAIGGLSATGLPTAGSVEDTNGSMQEMRTIYNSHTHNENGDGGGITDDPNQQMN